MMDKAAMPEPTARAEVGRYCCVADPGVVVPHGLPRDPARSASAISRRADSRRVAPRDVPVEVLREFHDAIASSGALPLGLAERAVTAAS